jgi:hypothetical protein
VADQELAALVEATTLGTGDLLYAVVDPGGTPADRKITKANMQATMGPGISLLGAYPKAGRWNASSVDNSVDGTAIALVDEEERAAPLIVLRDGTIDRIGVKIDVTAGSAGSLIRLGIRNDNAGYPGATVVLDAGTVSGEVTTNVAITVSQALPAGLYWLTVTSQGAAGTQPKIQSAGIGSNRTTLVGALTQDSAMNPDWSNATAPIQTGVSGALPSSWTGTSRTSYWPLIAVRWA